MSVLSLLSHLALQHDVYSSCVIQRDLVVDRAQDVYYASKSTMGTYYCPVGQCVRQVYSKWNLQHHFYDCHPMDMVNVPREGIYSKFTRDANKPQCNYYNAPGYSNV